MCSILEILFLIGCLAAFRETAKRRRTKAWPFILVGALGWLLSRTIICPLIGVGPGILVSWAWVAVSYASIFLIGGGGRRMKESWRCPECRGFNPPTTLVCLCGYDPQQAAVEPGESA